MLTQSWGFTGSLQCIPFQKTGNFARFSSHRWGGSLQQILKKLGVFGYAEIQNSQNEGCLLQESVIFSSKQIDFKTSPFFWHSQNGSFNNTLSIPWDFRSRIGSAAALKLCQSPRMVFLCFFRPICVSRFCCFWHWNLVGWTLREEVSSKFQGSWRRCAWNMMEPTLGVLQTLKRFRIQSVLSCNRKRWLQFMKL